VYAALTHFTVINHTHTDDNDTPTPIKSCCQQHFWLKLCNWSLN